MSEPAEDVIYEKPWAIRDYKKEDEAFVTSCFLRGVYYGFDTGFRFELVPKDVFMQAYKPVINTFIVAANVKIACLKEDPDTIIGYSILSNDFQTIHWVYVKKKWRNMGIAKSLLPQFPISVTHLTKIGLSLLPKFPGCVFNPFSA